MRLLTLARDLGRRKARERQGLFVCEGVRATEELLRSPVTIRGALSSPELHDASGRAAAAVAGLRARGIEVLEVDRRDFESAAETETPQGILAIAAIPHAALDGLAVGGTKRFRLLVLDGLQDPGNVGTILRTAAAFDVAATIALPGTVDLWNAKVVRSAMGAHFHHPTYAATTEALAAFRARHHMALWAADAGGEPLDPACAPERLAIVVGNEGAGLSGPLRGQADKLVALPISTAVESLNVAVATGILLYELRP
ncbi:MAG TPA: RNA methyltransferase [Gemmatimonadaceae bacterium]